MRTTNENIDSIIDWLTEPDGGFAVTEGDIREAVFNLNKLKLPILSFKDNQGKAIDSDYVEPRLKQGFIKYYEIDCTMEVQEVYPQY